MRHSRPAAVPFATTNGRLLDDAGLTYTSASGLAVSTGFASSKSGAAGVYANLISGAPFTGGSTTTTKPLYLIQPSGVTEPAWPTGGIMFAVNCASSFAGYLFAFYNAGGLKVYSDQYGNVIAPGLQSQSTLGNVATGSVSAASVYIGVTTTGLYSATSNADVSVTVAGALAGQFKAAGLSTKHIIGSSAAPTAVVGTGAGTAPSAVTVAGTDMAGKVSLTTGTGTPKFRGCFHHDV